MQDSIPITLGKSASGDFAINLKPHTWVVGQSGVGKSTLLTNAFITLIQRGYGGIFEDPHGTAVQKIARFIPRSRMNDVIWIDPTADRVPGIIPHYTSKDEEQLFIQMFLTLLKSLHRDRWGDETERVLMGALMAVTEHYGFLNVPAVYLFVARQSFRKRILAACRNPLLQDFAAQYDEKLKASEQMAKFSPPLNKIDEFVLPVMRSLMSRDKAIDFARAMDDRRIILVDLSKGKLGAEVSSLTGSIILSNIAIQAMRRRADSPQFFAFVDECQNFLHGVDFETILSELRKFGVTLVLGSQYLTNFPSLTTLFGNAPNGIVYRVSGRDAMEIEENYREIGSANQIVNLHNYQFVAFFVRNGIPRATGAIDAKAKVKKTGTEPPARAVIAESLRRWGAPRAITDGAILKFLAA
jgi:Type IV secretion-system coupling protein DNA-binding domain